MRIDKFFIHPENGFNLEHYKIEPRRLLENVIDGNPELDIKVVARELELQEKSTSSKMAEGLNGSTSTEDLITVFDEATTKFEVDALIAAVILAVDPDFEYALIGISPNRYATTGMMM